MEWTPLSQRGYRNPCASKAEEIADVLIHSSDFVEGLGLHSGAMGISLFYLNYAKYSGKIEFKRRGLALIDQIIDRLNQETGKGAFSLCNGLAGIAWGLNYLVKNDFIKSDSSPITPEVDHYLAKTMLILIRRGDYDFLHGSLGIAQYFLSSNSVYSNMYLHQYIEELNAIAHRLPQNCIAWESELDRDTKLRGFNLGLAHGIPSILIFLSKTYEQSINKEMSQELLIGGLNYLASMEEEPSSHGSLFPSWSVKMGIANSRLGWCYGDIGVGLAFWFAGRALQNEIYKNKAIDIFLATTERRTLENSMVADAGICHGACGIAHIYNRLFNYTGRLEFKTASQHWYSYGLRMATHNDGPAGYKMRFDKDWLASNNLLTGVAGIGLTFLAALDEIEPKWDECLLIS